MTLEDLQRDKIIAEIELIKAQSENLNKKPVPEKEKWDVKIKKWTGVILSVISLGAATWGLLIPINNYVNERKNMLKYELNSQMIQQVTNLDSQDPSESDRAILLLSYYERNALPILFYKIERTSFLDNPNLVNNIIQVISNVYDTHKNEVREMIVDRIDARIEKIKSNDQIDHYDIYALYNLFLIIEQLPLDKLSKTEFLTIIKEKEKELRQLDPDESKLFSVFTKIKDCKNKLTNGEV